MHVCLFCLYEHVRACVCARVLLPLGTFIPPCSSRAAVCVVAGCGYKSGSEKERETERQRHSTSLILYLGNQVPRNTAHVERGAFRKRWQRDAHRCVLAFPRCFFLVLSHFLTTGLRPPAAETLNLFSDIFIHTLADFIWSCK